MKWLVMAVFAASASLVHTLMMGAMSWCFMLQKTRVRMSLGRERSFGDMGVLEDFFVLEDLF